MRLAGPLKSADEEAIIRAVHTIEQGELVVGPVVARRVLGFFIPFRRALTLDTRL
jgi:hypothetical protein